MTTSSTGRRIPVTESCAKAALENENMHPRTTERVFAIATGLQIISSSSCFLFSGTWFKGVPRRLRQIDVVTEKAAGLSQADFAECNVVVHLGLQLRRPCPVHLVQRFDDVVARYKAGSQLLPHARQLIFNVGNDLSRRFDAFLRRLGIAN